MSAASRQSRCPALEASPISCRAREGVDLRAIDEHAEAVQRLARSVVRVHVDRDVESQERKLADRVLRAVLVEIGGWLAALHEVRETEPVGVLALRAGDDARRACALWPERPRLGRVPGVKGMACAMLVPASKVASPKPSLNRVGDMAPPWLNVRANCQCGPTSLWRPAICKEEQVPCQPFRLRYLGEAPRDYVKPQAPNS